MKPLAFLPLALGVVITGCGRSAGLPEDTRKAAQQALQEGFAAFESRDYATARAKLDEALASGGVYAGSIVEARVKRAVAAAATGDMEFANAELAELEQTAPELDLVFAGRAFILKKQGKPAEARAALAKARQYNSQVQEFKD